jgi:hypothetical protein
MESFSHCIQLFKSWRPQWSLGILALMAFMVAPAALRTLAEVSLELAEISLNLCQMGLVVLRVCGL